MQINRVRSQEQIELITALALKIFPKFYAPYLADEHTRFFLNKFQSAHAVNAQIEQGFEYYLVKEDDSEIGYFGLSFSAGKMMIEKLYFLESSRGKGYGKKAVDFILARAVERGIFTVDLIVNQQSSDTILFYKRNGFNIVENVISEFEDHYKVANYKMEKQIR